MTRADDARTCCLTSGAITGRCSEVAPASVAKQTSGVNSKAMIASRPRRLTAHTQSLNDTRSRRLQAAGLGSRIGLVLTQEGQPTTPSTGCAVYVRRPRAVAGSTRCRRDEDETSFAAHRSAEALNGEGRLDRFPLRGQPAELTYPFLEACGSVDADPRRVSAL